jgi:hypothetical protein
MSESVYFVYWDVYKSNDLYEFLKIFLDAYKFILIC